MVKPHYFKNHRKEEGGLFRTVHLLSIYMPLTNKFLFCYSYVTQNLNISLKYLYINNIQSCLIFKGKELKPKNEMIMRVKRMTIEQGMRAGLSRFPHFHKLEV